MYLSDSDWNFVQEHIPIVCVDILPIQSSGSKKKIGLIKRGAPEVDAWCLLGGRVFKGERIDAAMQRIVHQALGPESQVRYGSWAVPDQVVEYLPSASSGSPHDPRKHAVSLTYTIELLGKLVPNGEAKDFCWFDSDRLPDKIGFGQEGIIASLVKRSHR